MVGVVAALALDVRLELGDGVTQRLAQVQKRPRVSPGASRGDMALAADLFLLVRALVIRVRGAAEPCLRAALQRRGRLLQLRLLLQAVLICAAPQSASVQGAPRGQRWLAQGWPAHSPSASS